MTTIGGLTSSPNVFIGDPGNNNYHHFLRSYANFIHIAEMIEEFGPALGLPYSFIKKTRKIPRKELKVAQQRLKEVKP
jgi:hypothetical protein